MDQHVDLFRINWYSLSYQFIKRLALDDPMLVTPDGKPTQLAQGWASYTEVSEPHSMAECPF